MIGNKVCFFQTIDSTNTHMKKHINTFKHGDIICAKIQTDGRGRRERFWVSTEGNLHLSLLLDLDVHDYSSFEVVMRVSNTVVDLLGDLGIKAKIKYPNDIVVNSKKICGMLIEKVEDKYVVGVGINVNLKEVHMYDFHPTSIYVERGKEIDYRDVLSMFIDNFNRSEEDLLDAIYELYKQRSIVINQSIQYDKKYHKVLDISKNGELVLKGKKLITPNEITLKELYHD